MGYNGAVMIPEQRKSFEPRPGPFIGPRNSPDIGPLLDREHGGVALQDPSEGLVARSWLGTASDTQIQISTQGVAPTVVVTDVDITEFSFTFDQNMNVVVSYVAGGVAKLNWFDVTVPAQVTTPFGALDSPKVSLDDKHPLANDTSDVIFSYVRDGSLYYRQQRERYLTERLICTAGELLNLGIASPLLRKTGMGKTQRFQWEFYR